MKNKLLLTFSFAFIVLMIIGFASAETLSKDKYSVDIPSDIGNNDITFNHDGFSLQMVTSNMKINNQENIKKGVEVDTSTISKANLQKGGKALEVLQAQPQKEDVQQYDYSNVFDGVDVSYSALDNSFKEKITINSKPTIVGSYYEIKMPINYDDRLTIKTGGIIRTSNFTYNGEIDFVDKVMTRFYMPQAFAEDANGNQINLSYKVDQSFFLFFFNKQNYISVLVPKSYLDNAVYPVVIDPTVVAGCADNPDTVVCNGGTFNGGIIDTWKNISITSATIGATGQCNGGTWGCLYLNSSMGWITINDSTIKAYGGNGNPSGGGSFVIYDGSPQGVYIKGSSIWAYGVTPACSSSNMQGAAGVVNIGNVGNLTIYNDVAFQLYGGNGCGKSNNGGNGGSSTWTSNSKNLNLIGTTNITITMNGGDAGVACPDAACYTGGASTLNINDNNVFGINRMLISKNAGTYAKCGGAVGNGANAAVTITTQGIFNYSGNISNTPGNGCSATGVGSFYFGNTTNTTASTGRLILNNGNIASSNDNELIYGNEFTLFNYTFQASSSFLNLTKDIARVGQFDGSSISGGTMTLFYLGNVGRIIVGNNSNNVNLGSTSYIVRPKSTYYQNLLVTLNAPNDGAITSNNTVIFNISGTDTSNLLNVTLYVNGLLIDNQSMSGISNTSIFSEYLSNGQYNWSANICDSTNVCAWADSNRTFNIALWSENSQNFTASTFETAYNTFTLNLSTIQVLSITPYLYYNNTPYLGVANCIGTNCIITRSLDLPLIWNQTLKNQFYWQITTSDGTNISTFNSTFKNQTVSRINFQQCNATYNTNISFNFTAYNEVNLNRILNFSFQGTFATWLGSGTVTKNVSISNSTTAEMAICSNQGGLNASTNALIQYVDSQGIYLTRNYYLVNQTYNNVTQNISLYLLNSSTGTLFNIFVQDSSLNPVTNALVVIQRYNAGTNSYNIVQTGLTDSFGNTNGFFDSPAGLYRFIIIVNGQVVLTTNQQNVVPIAGSYVLTFTIGSIPSPLPSALVGMNSSINYSSSTTTVTYTYINTNASFIYARLQVSLINQTGVFPSICNGNSTLQSGILTCNVGAFSGTMTAQAFINYGQGEILDQQTTADILNLGAIFGTAGLILGFFMLIIAGFIFLFDIRAGLLVLNLMVIVINSIGIINFGWVFIWGMIIVSIIIAIEVGE